MTDRPARFVRFREQRCIGYQSRDAGALAAVYEAVVEYDDDTLRTEWAVADGDGGAIRWTPFRPHIDREVKR